MTTRSRLGRTIGALCLAGLGAGCAGSPPPASFDGALQHLEADLLPQIAVQDADPLQAASLPAVTSSLPLAEQLPSAEAYPLQGGDFLHTLLWVSAGNGQAVTGSFALFQQRMASTSPTYLEQVERWRSDPQVFDAVLMAYQSYLRLRRQPGFEELEAVPFGSPQESPLVALPWTTSEQQQALRRFASFATGP